jgi:hypothetical protein
MANNRISTQEIAEILIKNIGKLEQTNIAIERTAKNITEQIKTVSGSVLKVEKPDVSDMEIIVEEFKQNQNRFLNHNKSLLSEVSELKSKSKLRLPNSVIYVLIGFSSLCICFVFFTTKINTYNELKEIRKERDYYLNALQQIPKKERDKYIKK